MLACNYHIFNADGKQVCKTAHLKVMQTGRESWVVVLQKTVGVHDLSSPLQKQRTPPITLCILPLAILLASENSFICQFQPNLPPDIMNYNPVHVNNL